MGFYRAMVEAAAERAADTGTADLVDLVHASEMGFDTNTFAQDVADEVADERRD